MKAAVVAAPHTVEVVERAVPEPGPGEVVVRVRAVALCGSDVNAYRGVHPRITLPCTPGHEFAGTVAVVGRSVADAWTGARVCVEPNLRCGRCRYCLRGRPNVCVDYRVLGEEPDLPGACAEFVRVPAANLHRLPDSVTFEQAALVQPLAIAYHGVDRAAPSEGERLLVIGAGAIGLGVLVAARARGAEVLVADRHADRLAVATAFGAARTVDVTVGDLAAQVRDWTDGYGVDAAFEAAGGRQHGSLDTALEVTASGGRVVVLGAFSPRIVPVDVVGAKYRELSVIGSQGHPGTFGPALRLVADGLETDRMVTHRTDLDGLADAFRSLDARTGGVLKIVIRP